MGKRGRKKGSGEYDTQLRIRLSQEDADDLRDICKMNDEKVSSVVRDLIRHYINRS